LNNGEADRYFTELKGPSEFHNILKSVDGMLEISKKDIPKLKSLRATAMLTNYINYITPETKVLPITIGILGEFEPSSLVYKGLYVYKDGYVIVCQIDETHYRSDKFLLENA
jgi:hypothetical protein